MTVRCGTCKKPVDDYGRVTRRYTLGSRRPGRVVAATCSACLTTGGRRALMDTHIGGYIVRCTSTTPPTWHLILAATSEKLRAYTDYQRATEDATRYERMTAGLS